MERGALVGAKTARPRHGQALELDGISCVSARAYVAVGSYFRGRNDGLTLAERFNGIRWTVQHTPHPAGGQDERVGRRLLRERDQVCRRRKR